MEPIPDPGEPDTAGSAAFEELVARFFEVEPRAAVEQAGVRVFEVEPRAAVQVEFGALSHPGLVRDVNEDHYLVVRRRRLRDVLLSNLPVELFDQAEQEAYTLAVADGVGGRAFG